MVAIRLMLAATVMLTGCGVVRNHQPIAAGTPTAMVHVGPVKGGFRAVTVQVHDGEQCHRGTFWRGHTIGSYLGSDVDVEVPAGKNLYFTVFSGENTVLNETDHHGLYHITCGGTVVLAPEAGAHYAMNLIEADKHCGIVLGRSDAGTAEPKLVQVLPHCPD